MRTLALAALIAAGLAGQAAAQAPATPEIIPAPGGEVIIPTPSHRKAYDAYGFAPARRAGDTLYISGVVFFRAPGEGDDVEAFKTQARRGFRQLETILKASNASFADVVMINSFHVWESPNFAGTRDQQFEVLKAVKDEFMPGAHPAWTAVGTSGLLAPRGIVEVQMIAHAPKR